MSNELILNELKSRDDLTSDERLIVDELLRREEEARSKQLPTPQNIQDVEFTLGELELWKRENLSAPRRAKMDDERAFNLMRVDFLESGVDKDTFLLGEAPSKTEQVVSGFGQGVRSLGQEAGKITLAAGDALGVVDPETREEFAEGVQRQRQEFSESVVGQMPLTQAAQVAGEIAPTIAIPGGVVGGIARRFVAGGLGGAAAASLSPTESADAISEERMQNMLTGAGFGSAFAGGTRLITKTPDFVGMFSKRGGKTQIKEDLSKLVSRSELAASDDAAKNIGVFLTPAERTNLPYIITKEAALDLPDDVALNLQVKLIDREDTLAKSVRELISSIAPDDPLRAKAIKEGYAEITNTAISPQFFQKISDHPILGPEYKRFLRNPDFKPALRDLPESSGKRLDEFQKYLRERSSNLYNKEGGGRRTGAKNLKDARRELLDALDEAIPSYALARREGQLEIIQKKMMEQASKLKANRNAIVDPKTGVRTPTAIQFYQKFLKSDEAFDDLIRNLDDTSDAALKATQLRVVLGAIEGSPIEKVFKSTDPVFFGATGGLGVVGVAAQKVAKAARKNFYEGMVDYITDPNLTSTLLEEAADVASKRAKTQDDLDFLVSQLQRFEARRRTQDVNSESQGE
tara:strand:- start:81 stop:1979 length:1899 start_codon:yes stop_codon:yes gene_type:complete